MSAYIQSYYFLAQAHKIPYYYYVPKMKQHEYYFCLFSPFRQAYKIRQILLHGHAVSRKCRLFGRWREIEILIARLYIYRGISFSRDADTIAFRIDASGIAKHLYITYHFCAAHLLLDYRHAFLGRRKHMAFLTDSTGKKLQYRAPNIRRQISVYYFIFTLQLPSTKVKPPLWPSLHAAIFFVNIRQYRFIISLCRSAICILDGCIYLSRAFEKYLSPLFHFEAFRRMSFSPYYSQDCHAAVTFVSH